MWNNHTSKQDQTRSSNPRRWLALCVLAGVLLPAFGAAQSPMVTVLKSGLQSIYVRHVLLLTVTEVGSPDSASEVTIEFRDASDQQRAFAVGTLQRTHPVRLRLPISGAGADQLRAIVKITPLTNGAASEPIVGLEDLDANSFQVVPRVTCSIGPTEPPGAQESPDGGGGCGGWRVNRLTLEQAANSRD